MAYSAMTYRMLISAPGDVSDHDCSIVMETVAGWNATYGPSFVATIVPLHWRLNSAPRHGERPQTTLNAQLVESVDIVLALFWHRLGTDTGEAESGTVEEIEVAHAAGAEVGILVCGRPYPQDLDTDQLERLRKYVERIKPHSLILGYDDDLSLARQTDAMIAQAVGRSGGKAQAAAKRGPAGAEVRSRIDSEERSVTDTKGKTSTKRTWRLVLSNTGDEAARDVSYRLEAEREEDDLPFDHGDGRPLEVLAPGAEAPYPLTMHMGVAPQARCVVNWSDSSGERESTTTVRFF